jgi:hypothetical protein
MNYSARPAGKIIGAVLGRFTIRWVRTGIGANGLSYARSVGPPRSGRGTIFRCQSSFFVAWLTGLVGGGFLGAFVGGRPVVAWWSLGTAIGLGFLSLVAGIAMWPHDQGPIIGIFIVAPLGFGTGALIGMTIGLARQRARHVS